jgi:hypothetical protein
MCVGHGIDLVRYATRASFNAGFFDSPNTLLNVLGSSLSQYGALIWGGGNTGLMIHVDGNNTHFAVNGLSIQHTTITTGNPSSPWNGAIFALTDDGSHIGVVTGLTPSDLPLIDGKLNCSLTIGID